MTWILFHVFKGPDPLWGKLWKFKVPPKIRDFVWRACWDSIPHGLNLNSKGIPNFVGCKRCGPDEHLMHFLFECHWAKMLWDSSKLDLEGRRFPSFRDALDWVWLNLGVAKDRTLRYFVLTSLESKE